MAVEVGRSGSWSAAVAVVLVAMAAALVPQAALAKTYTVTRTSDPAPGACQASNCSLREAVLAANAHVGSDRVVLPNHRHPYLLTIPGTGEDGALDGDLDVTNDPLKLIHPGKGRATVRGNGIGERIFEVFTGAPTTFDRLVITGGANPATSDFEGGGIRSDADLVVLDSRIVRNTSNHFGGGIGLQNGAGLRLIRSTVANNHTTGSQVDGGGIDGDSGALVIKRSRIVGNRSTGNGGAMYFFSQEPSLIAKSTISGNQAAQGGGAINDTQGPTNPPLRIIGSTISGNQAGSGGGGGILVGGGHLVLSDSTFAANRAGDLGGAIWNAGGQVTANAITVARNVAGPGGGGLFYGSGAPGFDVRNSLIALNRLGDGTPNDCAGDEAFDSFGHNLLSTLGPMGTCQGFDQPGDLVRGRPKIGALAKNGGPTKTIALKKHSPAIGKANRNTAPQRDQRGRKRDHRPDIGAFERLP